MKEETPEKKTKEEHKEFNEERKFKKDSIISCGKHCSEIRCEAWELSMTLAIRWWPVMLERRVISAWRRTPAYHELKIERKPGSWVRRICSSCDATDSHGQRKGHFEVTGKGERELWKTRGTRWNPEHRETGSLWIKESEAQDKCSDGHRVWCSEVEKHNREEGHSLRASILSVTEKQYLRCLCIWRPKKSGGQDSFMEATNNQYLEVRKPKHRYLWVQKRQFPPPSGNVG